MSTKDPNPPQKEPEPPKAPSIEGRPGNPINPVESGLTFSDKPEENPAAYPTEPETPGAKPENTAEGVAKAKGKEPYLPFEEDDPAKKGAVLPGVDIKKEATKAENKK
jgi:hypothetical protein